MSCQIAIVCQHNLTENIVHLFDDLTKKQVVLGQTGIKASTLSPIIMEVENGGLEDDWLVSFRGPCSTSMIMGGRVYAFMSIPTVTIW